MLIILEHILTQAEVAAMRTELDRAGWQDGAKTAGTLAKQVKRNQQLDDASPLAIDLGHRILRKLGSHPGFLSAALPHYIYPPKFNRYADGGHYGLHVDSALMQVPGTAVTVRSDLSATLFLSEPHEYDGGELQIETAFGAQSVKLDAGDLVLYPSGSLHQVTPVTAGARVASFFWIQSMVQDDRMRTQLYELDQAIQAITPSRSADDSALLRLTAVYHNLLRAAAQT